MGEDDDDDKDPDIDDALGGVGNDIREGEDNGIDVVFVRGHGMELRYAVVVVADVAHWCDGVGERGGELVVDA